MVKGSRLFRGWHKKFYFQPRSGLGSALRHVFLHYRRTVAQANARLGVLLDGGLECLLRPGGEAERQTTAFDADQARCRSWVKDGGRNMSAMSPLTPDSGWRADIAPGRFRANS